MKNHQEFKNEVTKDSTLLKEFKNDYHKIIMNLISENFGDNLVDMSLPTEIKELYEKKWRTKAEVFEDINTKNTIYALLTKLNLFSEEYLNGTILPFIIRDTRSEVANIYAEIY